MSETTGACSTKCWTAAAAVGAAVALLTLALTARGVPAALVLGLLAFGLLGLLFNWLYCAPVPKSGEGPASAAQTAAKATGVAGATAASAAAGSGAVAAAAKPAAAAPAKAPVAAPATEAVAAPAAGADKPAEAGTKAAAEAQPVAAAAVSDAILVKPSKALAGEADLDSRKGTWKYEGDGATKPAKPKAGKAKAKAADAVSKPAKGKAAAEKPAKGKAKAAKGGDPAASGADQDAVDRDRDGKVEGTDEGTKPKMLKGPRAEGADNLKEIKGIGPKLEVLCNTLGVYHFDQIAAWTADELAWVDANLAGFKGRATRDDWVGQAKILATGAETEFSKRVEDGKVY